MFKKKKKKQVKNKGTCLWINEVGTIRIRVFNIVEIVDGNITIDFGNNERYVIGEKNLRARRTIIYKTSSGRIVVQNPEHWKNIQLKKHNIKELRFNLQNFAIQEGKASIHRWTIPKDALSKLTPLFKLLMICIAVSVIGWAAFQFSIHVFDVVIQSRLTDCGSILPRIPIPIGANLTVPIGT